MKTETTNTHEEEADILKFLGDLIPDNANLKIKSWEELNKSGIIIGGPITPYNSSSELESKNYENRNNKRKL